MAQQNSVQKRRRTSSLSHTFSLPNDDQKLDQLNVNLATEEELMTLSGVTRDIAKAIVKNRQAIGPFRKIEDLALVGGIGANKLDKIRGEICVKSNSCGSSRAQSFDPLKSPDAKIPKLVDVDDRANVFEHESDENDGEINFIQKFLENYKQLSESSNKLSTKRVNHKTKTSSEENQEGNQHRYSLPNDDQKLDQLNVNLATEEEFITLPGVTRDVDEICVKSNSCGSSRAQSFDSLKSPDAKIPKLVDVNRANVFELQCVNGMKQEMSAKRDIKTFFKWKQQINFNQKSNKLSKKRVNHKTKTFIEENQEGNQHRYSPIHGSMCVHFGNLEKLFEMVDALLDADTDIHSLLNTNQHVLKENTTEPQWNKTNFPDVNHSPPKLKHNFVKYLERGDPLLKGRKELPQGKWNCLMDMCFLRTGVLDSLDPNDFNDLIYKHGGRTVKAVSRKIDYMVVGTDPGPSKLKKSRSFRIPEISEDDLLDMILVKSGQRARYKMQKENNTVKTEVQTDIFPGIDIINQHSHPFCAANKLIQWLSNWFIYHGLNKLKLERPTQADNLYSDGAYYKVALLSGERRSFGKMIATQLGFNVMEVNTSDMLNEVILKEKGCKVAVSPKKKHPLFLYNIDASISIDIFVTLIKIASVPIIYTCINPEHPRENPFVKYCFNIKF